MSLWKNNLCKIKGQRDRVVSSGFGCRSGRPLAGSFAVVASSNPGSNQLVLSLYLEFLIPVMLYLDYLFLITVLVIETNLIS